ncbi:hypothetical protein QTP70_034814, partial [Hemibagrus guttatus]
MVRPAMLYGLEKVSLRKRQESELEVAELKMLSGSCQVVGYIRQQVKSQVLRLMCWKHGKMGHFEKNQIVMARRLGQGISKTVV